MQALDTKVASKPPENLQNSSSVKVDVDLNEVEKKIHALKKGFKSLKDESETNV